MLKFFSRLEKTRNFLLFAFAILMVASLVFFYAPTRNLVQENLSNSTATAASVSGEKVTLGELARQKESMDRFGGGRAFPSKMMIDGLIRQRILRVEADRLGLRATDAEVAGEIRQQNKSTDGTPFDQALYERNVTEQYGGVADYEQTVRDQLSAQKLQAFLTSGVTVSEDELLKDFQRKNTKFDLSYVPVSVTELAQTVKPTDDELKTYFEQNKKSYYISVPQKKVRYVFLNTTKIGEKIQIPEADLKAEYDKNPKAQIQPGAAGQEIVLRIPKPEQDAQVSAKANEIVQTARKNGGKISAEAFGELAKGQSENPVTAQRGGNLPGLVKENKAKPDDPYQKLLTMQPGEVSEPINYQGKYYILRRGEDVAKTFEEAKQGLEISARNRRGYAAAAELAQKVADSLKQTKDAAKTAAEFAAQANMSATEMVRETPFVKPGDTVENIGISPQFEEGIAPLENTGDVGEKISIQNGFAVPILIDKKDPRDADLAEVKDQVAEVVKLDKAKAQVEEVAKQIAAAAPNAGGLNAAAQSKNLKAQEAKSFILGSPLGQGPSAATNEQLEDAIFAMKAGDVTKTPLKVGDNWYIVGVNSREDSKTEEFAKQRDTLLESSLQQKRGAIFSDYLTAVRAAMEKNNDIKIYKDVVDRLDATDAAEPEIPVG